jgi:serine/threonine protein kinase
VVLMSDVGSSSSTSATALNVNSSEPSDVGVQIGVSVAAAACLLALMVAVAVAAACYLRRLAVAVARSRTRASQLADAAHANASSDDDTDSLSSVSGSSPRGVGAAGGSDSVATYADARLESTEVPAHLLPVLCVPSVIAIPADGDGELDVDSAYATSLTLSCDREISYRFAPVAAATFDVAFSPSSGQLKPHEPLAVSVTLTPRCTTVIDARVALHVSQRDLDASGKKQSAGVKHALLSLRARSKQSIKLDYDLLGDLKPAAASLTAAAAQGDDDGRLLAGKWNGHAVLVKLLRIQQFDDRKVEEAFDKEVALLSKLRHRNIVAVIAATMQPSKLSVVTEFVEGSVLSVASVSGGSALPRAIRLKATLDVAEALGFLHRCDVLHRNLKPSNILLVSRDPRASVHAKVTGFGACRSLADRVAMAHRVGIGRPVYTAPEILCLQPYSVSSDVYSLAMCLVFLFSAAEPFERIVSHWEVVEAIVSGKRPDLDEQQIGDPTLVALIKACWNADVNERPDMRVVVATVKDVVGVATKVDSHSLLQQQETDSFLAKRPPKKTKKLKKGSAADASTSSTTGF